MRKSTKVLKRLLSLFLVVLISINAYAAIVGDNDGAAFVTKAEFDSLRNTFDAQINQYNSSIDNKIDGAIGAYLAGVKTNDKPYIMLDDIKGSVGRDLRFNNRIVTGNSTMTTQYLANRQKSYSFTYIDKDAGGWKQIGADTGWKKWPNAKRVMAGAKWCYQGGPNFDCNACFRVNKKVLWSSTNTNSNWGVIVYCKKKYTGANQNVWSQGVACGYNLYGIPNDGDEPEETTAITFGYVADPPRMLLFSFDNSPWIVFDWENIVSALGSYEPFACAVAAQATSSVWTDMSSASDFIGGPGGIWALFPAATMKPHYVFLNTWSQTGSGNVWFKMDLADGNKMLLGNRNCYPLAIINYASQWYKNFGEVSLKDTVFNYTTAHSHTLTAPSNWYYKAEGTRYTSYSENDNKLWYEVMLNLYQGQMSYQSIQQDQYADSNPFANNLYYLDLYVQPTITGAIGSNLSWAQSSHSMEGYTSSLGATTITMNGVKLTPTAANLRTFEQLYLTGLAGEVVWMGGGAPLMRMRAEQSTEYTVKMDLLSRNSSGTAANSTVTVRLSLKQFKDGNFNATTDKIYEANINCNSSGKGTATFDITGIPKDTVVWYSLYSSTGYYTAECTKCTVTIK